MAILSKPGDFRRKPHQRPIRGNGDRPQRGKKSRPCAETPDLEKFYLIYHEFPREFPRDDVHNFLDKALEKLETGGGGELLLTTLKASFEKRFRRRLPLDILRDKDLIKAYLEATNAKIYLVVGNVITKRVRSVR